VWGFAVLRSVLILEHLRAGWRQLRKRMRSGDRPGLQNRRAAGFPVAGGFDPHSLPPFRSFIRSARRVRHHFGETELERRHHLKTPLPVCDRRNLLRRFRPAQFLGV